MNEYVYIHQRFSLRMGRRGDMVELIRTRWAPHLERRHGVRLTGLWATVGSTGDWPEMRVQWEFDGWDHFARASADQHPMEERDTYLTELSNRALEFRRGGHSMLLLPAPFSPDLRTGRADGTTDGVLVCEHLRTRPGRMRSYHEALASRGVPLAMAQGMRLIGAYEHAIVPNTGLNLWALPGWDEWRTLMERSSGRGVAGWNEAVDEWLADLDSCLIVAPPPEALRT